MTPSPNEDPAPPPIPPSAPQHISQMSPPLPQKTNAPRKSLTLPWILGLVVVGGLSLLLSLVEAKFHVGVVDTPYKTGYIFGVGLGCLMFPLVVCGICALFKWFRKNPRRLAVVAISIWALIGLGNIGQLGMLPNYPTSDKVAIDDAKREIARLKARAAQTTDPQELAEIQRQMDEKFRKSGENFSQEMRTQQQALLAFIRPYQDLNADYLQRAAVVSKIEGGWLWAFSKSSESLKAGRAQIKELADANKNLLKTLNALVAETDRRLKAKDTSSGINLEVLAGFRSTFVKGDSLYYQRLLRDTDARIWSDADEVLKLLQDNAALWERDNDDSSLRYKDNAFQQQVQTLLDDIETVAEQQEAARQQYLRASSAQ